MFGRVFPSVFAAFLKMYWLVSVSWITFDCFDAHDRVSKCSRRRLRMVACTQSARNISWLCKPSIYAMCLELMIHCFFIT